MPRITGMATTRELIDELRQADPEGCREVWLEIHNGSRSSDARTFTDSLTSPPLVRVDELGDVVITGETE